MPEETQTRKKPEPLKPWPTLHEQRYAVKSAKLSWGDKLGETQSHGEFRILKQAELVAQDIYNESDKACRVWVEHTSVVTIFYSPDDFFEAPARHTASPETKEPE